MQITGSGLSPVKRPPQEQDLNGLKEDGSPEKRVCIETALKVEASIQRVSQEREKSPIDLFIELLAQKKSQIAPTSPEERDACKKKFDKAKKEFSELKVNKEEYFNTLLSCLKKTDGVAENYLAQYYLFGIMVERDLQKSFDLFLDGVVQCKFSCQIYLVYLFSLKEFEHFCLEKAKYCFSLVKTEGAAENLNNTVKFFITHKKDFMNLNFMYLCCNALLSTSYQASALYYLSLVEELGCEFCLQNKEKALEKLKSSASLGNIDAILCLARGLSEKPETFIEALDIYQLGIKQDHFIAKYEAAELMRFEYQKTAIALFEEIIIDTRATKEQRMKALDYLNTKYISDICMRRFFQRAKKALEKYPEEKDHLFLIGKEIFLLRPFNGHILIMKAIELGSVQAQKYLNRLKINNENKKPSVTAVLT